MRSDDSVAAGAAPPRRPSANLREARLLRLRILVPIVALAVLPPIAVGLWMISRVQAALLENALEEVSFGTAAKAQSVADYFEAVQQDLRFLSQTQSLTALADACAAGEPAAMASARETVERELLTFSNGKRAYYQVRYLDGTGMEIVRLNVDNGIPRLVPATELQNKSDRYYVREAMLLEPGRIYVSRMDLNIEYGSIELPIRGVVRYATPVAGHAGRREGLLVINIGADFIFTLLSPQPEATEAWLVDETGAYLGYIGPDAAKVARYTLTAGRRLQEDYGTEEAARILSERRAGRTLERKSDLVSFAALPIATEPTERHWTTILAYPRESLEAPTRPLVAFLSWALAVVAAVAGVLGLVVARRFEGMAARLREAQVQLAASNVHLETEVARQTAALQELQLGLARADKLASIGQMTAGVMHEIGNPLAAIKTKIQVAEEEGAICNDCVQLRSEVIGEVDRLASFLRSFSRLAKVPRAEFERLALEETVRSIARLMSPELQRRRLALRWESEPGTPLIDGNSNQIGQLLINLILNAAEATPRSGVIRIRVRPAPSEVGTTLQRVGAAIEVTDDGVGIRPEDLERIFDQFFTTKAEGTGLGLAICREIVEDHGGTITVRSERGKGTEVRVVFPPAPPASHQEHALGTGSVTTAPADGREGEA